MSDVSGKENTMEAIRSILENKYSVSDVTKLSYSECLEKIAIAKGLDEETAKTNSVIENERYWASKGK